MAQMTPDQLDPHKTYGLYEVTRLCGLSQNPFYYRAVVQGVASENSKGRMEIKGKDAIPLLQECLNSPKRATKKSALDAPINVDKTLVKPISSDSKVKHKRRMVAPLPPGFKCWEDVIKAVRATLNSDRYYQMRGLSKKFGIMQNGIFLRPENRRHVRESDGEKVVRGDHAKRILIKALRGRSYLGAQMKAMKAQKKAQKYQKDVATPPAAPSQPSTPATPKDSSPEKQLARITSLVNDVREYLSTEPREDALMIACILKNYYEKE